MKILFYWPEKELATNNRTHNFSYSNLDIGGFSGTENAVLEMSKYFVSCGHSVTIAGCVKSFIDHGINFVAYDDFHILDFNIDWYCPIYFTNMPHHKMILSKLNRNTVKILLWLHCFINDNEIIDLQNQNYDIYLQCVSDYVLDKYKYLVNDSHIWTINNGIKESFINSNISSKQNNWIFHASFERGGDIALDIYRQIRQINESYALKFSLLSYYRPDNNYINNNENIINIGSVGKYTLLNILLDSQYFIYPLVLSNTVVHHDCHPTVILEALSTGNIVITWDVACMNSCFSNYIVKIPVPEYIQKQYNYNPKDRFSSCAWMLSQEAKRLFINEIIKLENNKNLKNQIINDGKKFSSNFSWDLKARHMETKLLQYV